MLGWPRPRNPLFFVGGLAPYASHRGLRPQSPDAFGLNPPSQLDLGYHWLAFLNQVRRNLFQVPSSLLNTKSTISKKLKITQKKASVRIFY